MTLAQPRRGFALILALGAILLASALVITVSYRVQAESALARSGTLRRLAITAAETAAWGAMNGADLSMLRANEIGVTSRAVVTDGLDTTVVTVTKTDTTAVWIVATASILRGRQRARHRVAVSARVSRDTARSYLAPLAGIAWVETF